MKHPEVMREALKKYRAGATQEQVRAWLKSDHSIEVSRAGISRWLERAANHEAETAAKTETVITVKEATEGEPEAEDDSLCLLFRNEIARELHRMKKERDEGKISSAEYRGALIQFSKANSDAVLTRWKIRQPKPAPQAPNAAAPPEEEKPIAEVVFN